MNSKWIDVPSANAPAAEVARQALAARVAKIKRMLPLAADKYQEDVEHVHRLRTSCRRAAAAVEAFRPLMSGKLKALGRLLRQIHKAAGPARDTDVLLARFDNQLPAEENLDYVIARLHLQRESAQKALAKVAKKSQPGKLKKAAQRTLDSLGRGDRDARQVSFGQFGRDALQAASQAVFQLTNVSQPTIAQLHQLRIAGKRLRYSIELFHGVFPPEMRGEVYPMVEELQERLGRLNDHATAQAMFQRWLADLPPGQRAVYLAQRIVAEYDAAIEVRREFLEWWTNQQITALESRLSTLLQPTN
ncbi:MAG: CHAD domain-containing protein [Planctomycetes bacterium]|nr:CHAD domain-containing protein [Planctomycetota bacterium]